MGAGVALLAHDSKSANAVEALNLTQDSPAATSSTQTQPSNAISMPTASRDDEDDYRAPVFSSASSMSPAAKAPAVITLPGSASNDIILPPTKKGGDDDDDDEEDDD
jgi:hypothetical protein